MEIKKGTKRIVILIGPLALKIARIGSLFSALLINLKEFVYYIRYRNSNMMPTYFSIGFINLQRRGKPIDFDFKKTNKMILELYIRDRHIPDCKLHLESGSLAHHWDQYNLCFDSMGTVRMIDYGDHDVVWFLLKYPDFFEPFRKVIK